MVTRTHLGGRSWLNDSNRIPLFEGSAAKILRVIKLFLDFELQHFAMLLLLILDR
jgi:hypothetical protein